MTTFLLHFEKSVRRLLRGPVADLWQEANELCSYIVKILKAIYDSWGYL